jgi:hypothetical protein
MVRGGEMTREEILSMEAGRELDALVAVEVMGWHNDHEVPYYDWVQESNEVIHISKRWSPSSDIGAAWEVVEKMIANGWWNTDIGFGSGIVVSFDDGSTTHQAKADTAPLAICRAALLAVMEEG